MTKTVTLPLDPVPYPRPRVNRRGEVYYPKTYSTWKGAAYRQVPGAVANAGIFKPLLVPLLVTLVLRVTRPKTTKFQFPKPDVDNYAKSVLDACNGIAWEDDSQIVKLTVSKEWAEPGVPGNIEIHIDQL